MKYWAASVDRVLEMRRVARLEADKRELVRILQEVEERCAVVVNRQVHEVLEGVPSWRSKSGEAKPASPRVARPGGLKTWRELQKRMEFRLSAETRKRRQREAEIAGVMGEGPMPKSLGSSEGPRPETVAVTGESNGGA